MVRHFLTLASLSQAELLTLLRDARRLKRERGRHERPLEGKSIVVIFEKSSTRTRLSFEIGIAELGAYPSILIAKDSQMGRGEPLEDTAAMLSRYAHAVVYRTFAHSKLEQLARASTIPVINGLTDLHHPCQLLADLMTLQEAFGEDLSKLRVAWLGDGNNMAVSWVEAAALLGFELRLASPPGYEVPDALIPAGARVRRVSPDEACANADVVTTDVWTSMGQEEENAVRLQAFSSFAVTAERMKMAAHGGIFLHCLPAHRGEEVEASVIDGPASRVFDEAENRLHAQKALLLFLLEVGA